MPALISQALGLYHAEHCTGTFHNTFITFSSTPELVEIFRSGHLRRNLRYIQSSKWEFSTNLEAVFDLILRTAVNAGTPQEEMPSTLFIISDMEFNSAMWKIRIKPFITTQKLHLKPKAIICQLLYFIMSTAGRCRLQSESHQGTALSRVVPEPTPSTTNLMGKLPPMDHMLRVLNSPRYAAVHA